MMVHHAHRSRTSCSAGAPTSRPTRPSGTARTHLLGAFALANTSRTRAHHERRAVLRLLQQFYDAHRDKVTLVCAVTGTVAGEPDTYAIRLVRAPDLPGTPALPCAYQQVLLPGADCWCRSRTFHATHTAAQAQFASVAGVHAFSVQPSFPKVRSTTHQPCRCARTPANPPPAVAVLLSRAPRT